MLQLVIFLIVIGVCMTMLNRYGGRWIGSPWMGFINAIVIICVVVYIFYAFGILPMKDLPVPQVQ